MCACTCEGRRLWRPLLLVVVEVTFLCPPLLRSTVLQQQCNKVGKVETGSVALPAIMRSGAGGPESFQMGSMPQAKQHVTSGQMHRGHMPPLVRLSLSGGSSRWAELLLAGRGFC